MDIINVFTLLLLSEQKLLTYDKKKIKGIDSPVYHKKFGFL